jgi:spore maturation protein CgeB
MAGACYLTEWTAGLDQLYDLGVEIETYRDAPELAEKAQWLLNDSARRKRMRKHGQARALQEHSIARTLDKVAARLNL